MECARCEIRPAIGKCVTCEEVLCIACSKKCQGCGGVTCSDHVTVTPHGRSLCPTCWARREAKRREQHAQRAGKGQASKPAAGPAVEKQAAAHRASAAADATSFEALMGGDAAADHAAPDEDAPAHEGDRKRKRPHTPAAERDAHEDHDDDLTAGKSKQFHREVPEREALNIDRRRPILTESGYKPPSKLAYLAAFIFFGIAGIFFINSSPRVQDMMFPFELGGIEYDENMRPIDQDTNALRNSSNISNFTLMRDLPLFLLTWAIVLVYVWGAFLVAKEVIPTLYQRWKGWRNERRMRQTW